MNGQAAVLASGEFVRSMRDVRPLVILDCLPTLDGFQRDEVVLLIRCPDDLDGSQLCPIVRADGYNRQVEDWGQQ